jgi:hypothetical protein
MYADDATGASILGCSPGASASKSIYALQKENEAYYKFMIWNRGETLKCGVAHNCVARYCTFIAALIRTSDRRDVVASKAQILSRTLSGAKAVREVTALKKLEDAKPWLTDGTARTRQSAAYLRQKIDPSNSGFFAARCENVFPEIDPRIAPARQDFEVVIASSTAAVDLSLLSRRRNKCGRKRMNNCRS